ncbi:MAG: hypothetical protein ACFNZV_08005 [Rothia dentocariosa]
MYSTGACPFPYMHDSATASHAKQPVEAMQDYVAWYRNRLTHEAARHAAPKCTVHDEYP